MNKRPIEQARDSDLRLSMPAMLRAASRARELAISTGTTLVVVHEGRVVHLDSAAIEEATQATAVHEPSADSRTGK